MTSNAALIKWPFRMTIVALMPRFTYNKLFCMLGNIGGFSSCKHDLIL